jgi:hypothetical protein
VSKQTRNETFLNGSSRPEGIPAVLKSATNEEINVVELRVAACL